eukprot:SAG22_NODE_19385_length_275_cov_0.880682_2_plen_54_part_01
MNGVAAPSDESFCRSFADDVLSDLSSSGSQSFHSTIAGIASGATEQGNQEERAM